MPATSRPPADSDRATWQWRSAGVSSSWRNLSEAISDALCGARREGKPQAEIRMGANSKTYVARLAELTLHKLVEGKLAQVGELREVR